MVNGLIKLPIIDSHVHLWDLGLNINTWVTHSHQENLQRNYLLKDYLTSTNELNIKAIVTIEAANSLNTIDEINWLDNQQKDFTHIRYKHIAYINMLNDSKEFLLNLKAFKSHSFIAGFRHILSQTPISGYYSPNSIDFTQNITVRNNFASNLAILGQNNYVFDCQLYPQQLLFIRDILIESNTTCIIEHCALPTYAKHPDYQVWLEVLKTFNKADNIYFKLSGFDLNNNYKHYEDIVLNLCRYINPAKLLFGSNYPFISASSSIEQLISLLSQHNLTTTLENILWHNAWQAYNFSQENL